MVDVSSFEKYFFRKNSLPNLLIFSFAISVVLTACASNKNNIDETNVADTANENSNAKIVNELDEQNSQDSSIDNGGAIMEDVKIKLMFNNEEVIVNMYDNPTSRDFLTKLPLTITLEDYAGTEKISYLSKKLSTEEAPSGSDPSIGDFAYYAPWGNLAIYYKDFGYSNGLIKLGKIESGLENLETMKENFTVYIEIVD